MCLAGLEITLRSQPGPGVSAMSKTGMMLTFTATMAFAAFCFAQQNAAPDAQASAPKDAQAPGSKDAHAPAYETSAVLKVKTRLVVVDVVARDSKGTPVT